MTVNSTALKAPHISLYILSLICRFLLKYPWYSTFKLVNSLEMSSCNAWDWLGQSVDTVSDWIESWESNGEFPFHPVMNSHCDRSLPKFIMPWNYMQDIICFGIDIYLYFWSNTREIVRTHSIREPSSGMITFLNMLNLEYCLHIINKPKKKKV